MTPEQKARKIIDQMLTDAGWDICDRKHYTPLSSAVAIEEGLLQGNLEADYLLFINGQAVGVLEAKRKETPLKDKVYQQAYKYTHKMPDWVPAYHDPLQLIYLSNGKTLLFKHTGNDDEPIELQRMHTPKEIAKLLDIPGEFAGLPALRQQYGNLRLRDCQVEAICNLELSFREGQRRALINIATGAGKTYTACLAAYRMLNYTKMKRILFLVDRTQLGEQAEGEFGRFRFTENGETFSNIFSVGRIKSKTMPDTSVTISTIQKLFSMLTGKGEVDDNDEESDFSDNDEPEVEVPDTLKLPHDYFDLIIVDECHRSIYSSWRKVLEYFDTARIVGLTATPVPQTLAFFNMNKVVDYTLEKSIADGVNVAHRTYRINTEATQGGGTIHKGDTATKHYRYNNNEEEWKVAEDVHYEANRLNHDIVNPMQIRKVLEEFKNIIYTKLYPYREPNLNYIPKTLIFAQDEAHAERIVKIAKDVFERPEDDNTFVQKITYSIDNPRKRIKQFRTDRDFRIAVTVTLVATGTDVKPLEIVMFMRDVESATLFIQMKGRGVRKIDDNALKNVTPNADTKDVFYLIDCVGVTEHGYSIPGPTVGTQQGSFLSLEKLLEKISLGNVSDEYLYDLAGRLSRINNHKASESQRREFAEKAGKAMYEIASDIYEHLDAMPEYESINQHNTERKHLVAPIANKPDVRELLLIIARGHVTILQPGEDKITQSEFSLEEANSTAEAFSKYINDHRDEIEALRLIYNNQVEPLRYDMLKDLENKLKMANYRFATAALWKTFSLIYPDKVYLPTEKDKLNALTNIIQLVRFAIHQQNSLDTFLHTSRQRFELWCGWRNRKKTQQQHDILLRVIDYIATNGFCTIDDLYDIDESTAAQIIRAFGTEDEADRNLDSLAKFIIYDQTA